MYKELLHQLVQKKYYLKYLQNIDYEQFNKTEIDRFIVALNEEARMNHNLSDVYLEWKEKAIQLGKEN